MNNNNNNNPIWSHMLFIQYTIFFNESIIYFHQKHIRGGQPLPHYYTLIQLMLQSCNYNSTTTLFTSYNHLKEILHKDILCV